MGFSLLHQVFPTVAVRALAAAAACLLLPLSAAAYKPVVVETATGGGSSAGAGAQALASSFSSLGGTLAAGAVETLDRQTGIPAQLPGSLGWMPQGGAAEGPWSLWGHSTLGRFESRPRAGVSLEQGRALSGYMGLDHRVGETTQVGVALSRGSGEFYYEDEAAGGGDVVAALTSVYSYGRWSPRQGLELWGLAGVGQGRAELIYAGRSEAGGTLDLRLAAAGARNRLLGLQDLEIAAKADFFAVKLEQDRALAVTQRARLGLEGTTTWNLTSQSRLTPRVELDARWDRVSTATGAGAEIGGGLYYAHQGYGLEVEVRGSRLLAHAGDLSEHRVGLQATLNY